MRNLWPVSYTHLKTMSNGIIACLATGAQIGLVLDRSASMDDPFAGGTDGRVGETKSVAAARLMTDFVSKRTNDMMGVITFSNSAMYVLPLTENKEAVLAAIKATAGNSLFQTNIGGGLTSAVGLFEKVPDSGSRVIILISDGAGRVSDEIQQKLRDWLQRYNITLYWVCLLYTSCLQFLKIGLVSRINHV